ncbi:MAG TPA: hypothetical protein VJN67_09715 [Stellaceae bacterium]|nr:hypothetical protein [Stellaceae bacterium]
MSGLLDPSPALLLAALLGGVCVVRSLGSWVSGLQLLIVAVLFGGMVGARLGSGAVPIAFRDIAIVLPVYGAFFLGKTGRQALASLPSELAIGFAVVFGWLAVCLFNLGNVSTLQLLIGLKVWAFYIPFLFVGIGLAARPEAMFKIFRTFLLLGLIAVGIGLVQSFMIRIIGYVPTMNLFFGEAAGAVTQGFTFFTAGGGVFRVPGTFSFNSQYVGFLYLFLTIGMIATNADPDPWYRKLGGISVFLALFASIVSGTKGALVTFPVFVVGFAFFGLMRSGFLMVAPVAIAVVLAAVTAVGVDLGGLFGYGATLTEQYAQSFFFQQIDHALQFGAFGRGIGTNTNGARYIAGADFGLLTGFESYFAKIAVELGIIGLVVYGSFLLIVAFRTALISLRNRLRKEIDIIGPFAIYIAFTLVTLFKAWSLDVDPVNIFFWLALGIVIGTERRARRELIAARDAPLEPVAEPSPAE